MAAESYISGDWSTPDLTGPAHAASANRARAGICGVRRLAGALGLPAQALAQRNTRTGSRKDIHAH
ncbi:MAG: hypothetical protein IPG19_13045 [Burkholderiales bacterium]|nr:hypothetical protein [Burkholderiales bacterium]